MVERWWFSAQTLYIFTGLTSIQRKWGYFIWKLRLYSHIHHINIFFGVYKVIHNLYWLSSDWVSMSAYKHLFPEQLCINVKVRLWFSATGNNSTASSHFQSLSVLCVDIDCCLTRLLNTTPKFSIQQHYILPTAFTCSMWYACFLGSVLKSCWFSVSGSGADITFIYLLMFNFIIHIKNKP